MDMRLRWTVVSALLLCNISVSDAIEHYKNGHHPLRVAAADAMGVVYNQMATTTDTQFTFSYFSTTENCAYRVYFDTTRTPTTGYPVGGIGAKFKVENENLYSYGANGQWTLVKPVTLKKSIAAGTVSLSWTLSRTDLGAFDCKGSFDYLGQTQVDQTIANGTKATITFTDSSSCNTPPPPPPSGVWKPALNTPWQWQLSKALNVATDIIPGVVMYDIDLFDNPASTVTELHKRGLKAVCYMSAGTYENWRPDANQFPAAALGKGNGWAGEKWLDIRNQAIRPIMTARMQLCKSKGFDAVEVDNIDGYTNNTGFPLTAADQITYNTFLANAAHAANLSIALKNDVDQLKQLLSVYDWALNEQCFQYNECGGYADFVKAGKAVFNVEYQLATTQFCPKANAMNINSMKKNLSLDPARTACR